MVPATEPPTDPAPQEMSAPDLAEYVQARSVTITVESKSGGSSNGSGFFIDDQGTVVTNYHVIDAADSISVEVSNGGKYDVKKIVDFNVNYDIAVLKIDITGNDYLELNPNEIRTGESVYAVGSSLGFLDGTFSNGIISSINRTVGVIDCIQTTAAISNGNSGGPLVNVYGEVCGINAFSYQGGENLNLAIRISQLDQLSMDKNWDINHFREWYKKEIERSYTVFDYGTQEMYLSKINTYQHVTERDCIASAYGWNWMEDSDNLVEGYDNTQGLYIYEYKVSEFDAYTEYLSSIGFSFKESKDYKQGVSYFYENEFTGVCMDIFILDGQEYVVIEPYYPE